MMEALISAMPQSEVGQHATTAAGTPMRLAVMDYALAPSTEPEFQERGLVAYVDFYLSPTTLSVGYLIARGDVSGSMVIAVMERGFFEVAGNRLIDWGHIPNPAVVTLVDQLEARHPESSFKRR